VVKTPKVATIIKMISFAAQLVKRQSAAGPAVYEAQSGWRQTALHVAQHKLDLLARYARKPLQELVGTRAISKVLQQRLDRQARAFEPPLAADLSGHPFDCGDIGSNRE
jgi:hypothetical protein